MSSTAAFVLVMLAAAGLALIGFALRILREEREQSGAAAADTVRAEVSPEDVSAHIEETQEQAHAEPEPTETGDRNTPGQLSTAATLLRDVDGQLVVEVDGRLYRSLAEVEDELVRACLEAAARDLERMLHLEAQEQETSVPEASTGAGDEAPAALPADLQAGDDATDDHYEPVRKISLQEAAQAPLQKPSMNLVEQWRILKQRRAEPRAEIKSMLDEIDDVLQARVEGTPWAARGLRVRADEVEGGAARFELDGVAYSDLDDIPEGDAREVIRASIKEWEKQ